MNWIRAFIPAIQWLSNYNKKDLSGDISAGFIVAVMLIPQGMAYGILAGLPPVMGLYTATIPLLIYALFGSSKQLAVGPVAMVSLLVFSGVSTLAEPGTNEYIAYVSLLSLMIGVIKLVLGLFRMGIVTNFLSHAVISGFTSAAAIMIGLSQLDHLLGIPLPQSQNVFLLLWAAAQEIPSIHLLTLLLGLGSILVLLLLKRLVPRFPAPILVVASSTLLVYLLQLDHQGVEIVGEVSNGFPSFSVPVFSLVGMKALFPLALTIALVGFMESIAVAKTLAAKENENVDANQELKALGLANIAGAFFSAYPATGGFSRSAVNYESGARTGLASIISAILILLTLLFFTPLFYYLPRAVLAAIIMVAVYGLIDLQGAKYLFRLNKVDGWTLLITFFATLVLGIEKGILLGAGISIFIFLLRSTRPETAVLGYLPKQKVFRNIAYYPEAKTEQDVLIFRVDNLSLYFAHMDFLRDRLDQELAKRPETKWIVLDFSEVNDMDALAVDAWEEIIKRNEQAGVCLRIVGMKGPLHDLVVKADWPEKYGFQLQYSSILEALRGIDAERKLG